MKRIEELNKEAVESREYGLMVLAVALAVWGSFAGECEILL